MDRCCCFGRDPPSWPHDFRNQWQTTSDKLLSTSGKPALAVRMLPTFQNHAGSAGFGDGRLTSRQRCYRRDLGMHRCRVEKECPNIAEGTLTIIIDVEGGRSIVSEMFCNGIVVNLALCVFILFHYISVHRRQITGHVGARDSAASLLIQATSSPDSIVAFRLGGTLVLLDCLGLVLLLLLPALAVFTSQCPIFLRYPLRRFRVAGWSFRPCAVVPKGVLGNFGVRLRADAEVGNFVAVEELSTYARVLLDDLNCFFDARGTFQLLICLLVGVEETLAMNLDGLVDHFPCLEVKQSVGFTLGLFKMTFDNLLAVLLPLQPLGTVAVIQAHDRLGSSLLRLGAIIVFLPDPLGLGWWQEIFVSQCFHNG